MTQFDASKHARDTSGRFAPTQSSESSLDLGAGGSDAALVSAPGAGDAYALAASPDMDETTARSLADTSNPETVRMAVALSPSEHGGPATAADPSPLVALASAMHWNRAEPTSRSASLVSALGW